jgi:hypothetical protein
MLNRDLFAGQKGLSGLYEIGRDGGYRSALRGGYR